MNANEILILNLEEVRRRSLKIWRGIPRDKFDWQPDGEAVNCLEMVRHVLEGEWFYHQMLKSGGNIETGETPFATRPFTDVEDEITFAKSYREEFLDFVGSLTEEDLASRNVDRSEKGYVRSFGDFILRMAYHESVHAGQMLSYLRTADAPRPNVWD